MVQRRTFPKEHCDDLWPCALLICVANVSEQGAFLLLGTPSKEGPRVGEGTAPGAPGIDECTVSSFGAKF